MTSLDKRLSILPFGLLSKNLIFEYIIQLNNLENIFDEERIEHIT